MAGFFQDNGLINTAMGQMNVSQNTYDVMLGSHQRYIDFVNALGTMDSEGNITLPNGDVINIQTISGASQYTVELQFLSAHNETISQVFNLIKTMDARLGQMVSG